MSLEKHSKVVAIIQARLTSTRFPKKVIRKIGGKRIIDHCISNVKKARLVDEVVVASPHKIPKITVPLFLGSEKDVLERYYECAKKFKADVIVRITSDCPFVDPEVIDIAINYYLRHDLGYVCFAPIDGMDVEVFGVYRLNEAFMNATSEYDREHVTPYIRQITKLSIDTPEDLKRAKEWYGLHK